jgi:hypothetical protein
MDVPPSRAGRWSSVRDEAIRFFPPPPLSAFAGSRAMSYPAWLATILSP